jgi:hypothetical protein
MIQSLIKKRFVIHGLMPYKEEEKAFTAILNLAPDRKSFIKKSKLKQQKYCLIFYNWCFMVL